MAKRQRPAAAAVALRLAGASYAEVADVVGYTSPNMARAAVENELGSLVDSADPEAKKSLRAEASARLECLLRSVWPKAMDPANAEHLSAVKTAMSLVDRHIRLHGLDQPQEVLVHNPTSAEIEAWVARVVSHQYSVIEQEPVLELEASVGT